MPDISHAQIIKARVSGAKKGQEFVVVLSKEIATRLLRLGIQDVAEHFRGKLLRVSGVVERLKQLSPETYRIKINNLDQLESVDKPKNHRRTKQ